MSLPRVAVIFTGGTISMKHDARAGGALPALDGAGILAVSPGIEQIAELVPLDWGMVPASHLRFAQILEINALIARQLATPDIAGVVVVQGTDTIEETAFAYDLLMRPGAADQSGSKPVVVTGAMRDASSIEYDGPRNLADAVRCAASPQMRGAGAVVVLAGSIVAADDAVKTHTTAIDTFMARDGVPIGQVSDGRVQITVPRGRRRSLPRVPEVAVEDVFLVTAVTGGDGSLVRGIAPLQPRGLVVAATGSGNTHPDLLVAAQELMAAGTVVCLSTRCPRGSVSPIYAFPGGGASWQRAGALLSPLDGPKTRVALALALAAEIKASDIAALLAG